MGSGGSGKRARDFSSSYMDVKMGELEFKKQCYADTLSEKKKEGERIDADRKNIFMLELIKLGKAPDEIDEYMQRFA